MGTFRCPDIYMSNTPKKIDIDLLYENECSPISLVSGSGFMIHVLIATSSQAVYIKYGDKILIPTSDNLKAFYDESTQTARIQYLDEIILEQNYLPEEYLEIELKSIGKY